MALRLRLGHLLRAALDRWSPGAGRRLVPRVSLDEYRANLVEVVRTARERNIAVVLLTRPFTGESPHEWWWKNFAARYNEVVLDVARQLEVPAIDIFTAFRGRDELFIDESHLTETGYRRMASIIHGSIQPLLPRKARVGTKNRAGPEPARAWRS